ncbi:similar to Saccharomyces cerevisiae YGR091W PRP31 Splicing factor, component of the U4/U6-U5 snRNP complex [Maudiozyma barnettii]|uniref:Similar to Saccharomyces cerevisiae YGR091W PRP31 Splicing factor, component of the U4/U6-U5 snRNP complex n=1 Tax=Maudiozyma barnettii TaxID=61262 RepID=A0A8H2VAW6_9SACH|nr:U4/U6-U5 snRNP complex subunit PRP31 [Kazachstania barnettii]CAB4251897.1 similar to Saccharomyces cerevisiae YGR091W PRP31 Splicing factor, component of the U4/U6-U5 snRNP complex [Kazachstania barnettii]CAD1778215.1 similar to Saccharomyces cerevisiae YGR091W PRP31 Splicing factor, component of the U4/U6-U5 snRNP complex [Kazachstania barnettii]
MSDFEDDDLANDLDNDFGEVSDVEEDNIEEIKDEIMSPPDDIEPSGDHKELTISEVIENLKKRIENYVPFDISDKTIESIEPQKISSILPVSRPVERLITENITKLEDVHTLLNELSPLITNDIRLLRKYINMIYAKRFDELETILPSDNQYAKVVKLLEQIDTKSTSETELSHQLLTLCELSKEQNLVVLMSMKTSFNNNMEFNQHMKTNLFQVSDNILSLIELQHNISRYISSKIELLAPNVSALVGPKVTSLLVSHAGGILGLSKIPSCNLASIGKNKHISYEQHTTASGIRQEGYISSTEIIQNLPISYHKQMLRMVCAKISLASRIDCSQRGTDKNNTMGLKWKEEIENKIKKLHESPNVTDDKALPIPEDKPKKKRAGRKFRKYKDQFKLSYARQLQNRMEFGKQETTVTDSFGEEVGLGMMNTPIQQATGSSHNNDRGGITKLSKNMKKRVREADEQTREYMLTLTGDTH